MTIEKAIKELRERYLYALEQEWIGDPVAWALYHVWKEAEEQRSKKDAKS